MQGSVRKRRTEIDLWEMERPQKNKSAKRNGRRRPGDVDIIDIYPDRENYSGRDYRPRQPDRAAERRNRGMESDGRSRRAGTEESYAGRSRRAGGVEPYAGQSRKAGEAEAYARNRRTVEPIEIGQRRMAEPVRRRRAVRPPEEDWDVEIIGQDWMEEPGRKPKSKKRKKAAKKRSFLRKTISLCAVILCLMISYMAVDLVHEYTKEEAKRRAVPATKEIIVEKEEEGGITQPDIVEDFLEINDFSRPGTKLPQVNSIFVHYTANPKTSAMQNRSYFANLAETQERSASAHFIIGYEGEIVQCMPLDEQAYAVMTRNEDSISIECCYLDKDGKFTQETYDSLVHLLAWLEQKYHLESGDILRHYDCGGKKCPLYYVDHEDAWEKLLADVEAYKAEHQ